VHQVGNKNRLTFTTSGSARISMQRFRIQHEELTDCIKEQNLLMVCVNICVSRKIICQPTTYTDLLNTNQSRGMTQI